MRADFSGLFKFPNTKDCTMRRIRLSLLATSISALLFSPASFAAAYQLYELGTPIIGTAGVGQAVVDDDASASYFNPAGMANLKSSQFMVGSQLLSPYVKFSPGSQTTISGDNGGNAGQLTPGLGMYYVYNLSQKLKLGLSLTQPYGGELDYADGWVGRYQVQTTQFYALDLNPALAYKINNKVSVGAGVTVEYVNLQETVALPFIPILDGQVNIKADNVAPGFNLGALFTPQKSTRVGITYRSRINHNLHGNLTFLRIAVSPSVATRLIMPQTVTASISQDVSRQFTLLGEVGWANWAQMKDASLTVAGFTANTPINWNNTYRLGVAGQFKCTQAIMLQAGGSFDSSPTSASLRLPSLPFDRQVRVGAGVVYNVNRAAKIGLSYEYLNFGRANINNTSSVGVLQGSYPRNYANTLQASINVDL
jgi:long-chain fatty acid transport protein